MFDWITGFIETVGFVGVAILMFLENVFPPIPSELIMPLAGFQATQGGGGIGRLILMIVAGSIGSLAGAALWYYVGKWIGRDRLLDWSRKHGRWLTITPDEFEKAEDWFGRYGGAAVFFGRLIPTVRTFISVPAGVTCMPLGRFLLYSAAGTVIWTTFLAVLGYILQSQYQKVESWLNPVSTGIVVLIVLYYLYRVVTFGRRTQEG